MFNQPADLVVGYAAIDAYGVPVAVIHVIALDTVLAIAGAEFQGQVRVALEVDPEPAFLGLICAAECEHFAFKAENFGDLIKGKALVRTRKGQAELAEFLVGHDSGGGEEPQGKGCNDNGTQHYAVPTKDRKA